MQYNLRGPTDLAKKGLAVTSGSNSVFAEADLNSNWDYRGGGGGKLQPRETTKSTREGSCSGS